MPRRTTTLDFGFGVKQQLPLAVHDKVPPLPLQPGLLARTITGTARYQRVVWISRRLAESIIVAGLTATALSILVLIVVEAAWHSGLLE